MSGDVQPRRRKDKKRKRDSLDRKSEGDVFDNKANAKEDDDGRESHHGVHATKLGTDDILLHVQDEHVTGGHWCAKILFFSLLVILVGLIGLIIMENRGLADLDTPLSKSRYSEYFEGWVDEHRQTHDEHSDKAINELEDGEAEKEEEDYAEEHDASEENQVHDNDDDEEAEENDADHNDNDNDDNEEIEEAKYDKLADNEEEKLVNDEDDNDEENDEDKDVESEIDKNEEDIKSRNDEENDNNDEENENNDEEIDNKVSESENEKNQYDFGNGNDPFDEFDDDAEESLEEIVDNDKEELEHLEKEAKKQNENDNNSETNADDYSTSLAVKIIVGLALAFVAHLVLIKKTKTDEITDGSISMKRRLTILTNEEIFLNDDGDFNDDFDDEQIDDLQDNEEEELINIENNQHQISYKKPELDAMKFEIEPQISKQMNLIYNTPIQVKNLMDQDQLWSLNRSNENEFVKNNDKQKNDKISVTELNENENQKIQNISSEISDKIKYLKNDNNNNNNKREEEEKEEELSKSINKNNDHKKQEQITDEENEEEQEQEQDDINDDEDDEEDGDDEEINDEDEEYDDEDKEAVFDIEDDELMRRLDEKYGKLPTYDDEEDDDDDELDVEYEPWTKIKSRTERGGEKNINYDHDDDDIDHDRLSINEQLRKAEDDQFQEKLESSLEIYDALLLKYPNNPGALYGKAKVLDRLSEKYHSNNILNKAIEAYKHFLATIYDENVININNITFKEAAERCIDRMRFRGLHFQAIPIHQMLIKYFDDDPYYRNQLVVTYLLLNRLSDAKEILNEILLRWPNNGFAQVHYGFILKNFDNNLKDAVKYLQQGIETKENGTQDGRFYFHLGDALQRLGKKNEAKTIYRHGAKLKLFPSEYQRSLYNVDGLKAKPFWTKKDTTYENFFNILERNWQIIRDEGLNVLNSKGLFMDEAENLKDKGDWKQFELFMRGYKNAKNCEKAPITCKLIETFPAARFCKRGQTKFSVMHPGTHVWPHCGPTNCRLRAHLGLKVPFGTRIKVANKERNWKEGEFLIFDDSFEHEVWHNGTSLRLVLIVDVWHPELSNEQRNTLKPI